VNSVGSSPTLATMLIAEIGILDLIVFVTIPLAGIIAHLVILNTRVQKLIGKLDDNRKHNTDAN
jgi:hypothetical protein